MALFRKRVTEMEAAATFGMSMLKAVQRDWPVIKARLERGLYSDPSVLDDGYASYEFFLAVLFWHMKTIDSWLPKDQAARICAWTTTSLKNDAVGDYPLEAMEQYQRAWDACLQKQEDPPPVAIAELLYRKLGCTETMEIAETSYLSPLALTGLMDSIVRFGGMWWKDFAKDHKIVRS